ncbi:MAG: single-stranded-DNA-specific exonuclease RecJ [Pseudomonadota bacterium]
MTGRRWEDRLGDPRSGLAIAQRLELPEVVGRAIAARNIGLDEAEAFLAPRLRAHLPDPSGFRDMDRAVVRLIKALEGEEKVAVFGDYDVDGATSAALLHRFLGALGRPPLLYIPDRMTEGYGPNERALLGLQQQGVSLVVTVDCGTTAAEPLARAADAGLDVIVLDHHAADAELPETAALVNPNRRDEAGRCRQLAAAGVTYLLLIALNRALRSAGWYKERLAEPDLLGLLDLVALGTVCDVVPLTGLNRAFVAQGLKVMARRANVGLSALGDVVKLAEPPGTYHAGFQFGPRINAGGRVGEAALGARLLTTEDPGEAASLAQRLDQFNQERREIERAVLEQALDQVAERPAGAGLTFAAGEGWHPGVIGIVASRLKERTNLPSLVVALGDDGIGKGSARSVPGVDLGRAVLDAKAAGLLINGGGHPMAAGLTVAADRLEALRDFLDQALAREMAEIAYRPVLGLDGALQPRAASFPLVAQLDRLSPFGVGNPEPRFALSAVRVVRPQVVGDGHLRFRLVGADGAGLKAIAFRAFDGALGEALSTAGGLPFHVAGKLRPDTWAGPEAVQMIVDDAAPASG